MALTRRDLSRAVAVIVLTALLVVAVRHIDVARATAELRAVRAPWLIAALCCYASILPLWAAQWTLLAPASEGNTFRRMFGVVTMTSAALNTTAFLVGEAAGTLLLVTRIGVSRVAALSVTAMDQLLVGVAKLCVLGAAALALSLPAWMRAGVATLLFGVAALLGACMLAAWRHELFASRLSAVIPARFTRAVSHLGEALAPLRSARRGGSAFALALAKKLVEVLAIVCVQHAFGLELPFASGVLVLAALNLATLVPVVPGNLGVYEGAVVLAYTYLGVPADRALGIAVVQHACYFVALALPGYAWLATFEASRSATAAS